MIKAIVKRPYEPIGRTRYIPNKLETLQEIVGGYIETVTLWVPDPEGAEKKIVVICDEDGRLKKYQMNCEVEGVQFVGTIIVVGVDRDKFADVPLTEREWQEIMHTPGQISVRI